MALQRRKSSTREPSRFASGRLDLGDSSRLGDYFPDWLASLGTTPWERTIILPQNSDAARALGAPLNGRALPFDIVAPTPGVSGDTGIVESIVEQPRASVVVYRCDLRRNPPVLAFHVRDWKLPRRIRLELRYC